MMQLLQKLEATGLLRELYNEGIISTKIAYYREICLSVEAQMKMGESKTGAVSYTAEKFRCSEKHVYAVLKQMNKPTREVKTTN